MAICCRNISEEEMHKRFFNLAVDASSVYPWQYDIRTHSFHFSGALLDYFGLPGSRLSCGKNWSFLSMRMIWKRLTDISRPFSKVRKWIPV